MRVLLRLVALLAGVMIAGLPAAAEADPVSRFPPPSTPQAAASWTSPARMLWTVADVDGDRVAELIRVAANPHGGRAVPEIVRRGCRIDARTSRVARVIDGTLTTRDLDADRDLDLVQLDAAGRPVRVWLNDGRGRFAAVLPGVARGRIPRAVFRPFRSAYRAETAEWHAPRERVASHTALPCLIAAPSPTSPRTGTASLSRRSTDRHPADGRGPPVFASLSSSR